MALLLSLTLVILWHPHPVPPSLRPLPLGEGKPARAVSWRPSPSSWRLMGGSTQGSGAALGPRSGHRLGRLQDGLNHLGVAGAPAQIPADAEPDVLLRGIRILQQQPHR